MGVNPGSDWRSNPYLSSLLGLQDNALFSVHVPRFLPLVYLKGFVAKGELIQFKNG